MRIRSFVLSICGTAVLLGVLYFFFSGQIFPQKSEPVSATSTPTSIPSTAQADTRGTLTGHITISPVCPVERIPEDPACKPKPYAALVDVSGRNNFSVEMHADADGKFFTMPPAGEYTITIRAESLYPRCPVTKATVEPGHVTTLDISCDSGIR